MKCYDISEHHGILVVGWLTAHQNCPPNWSFFYIFFLTGTQHSAELRSGLDTEILRLTFLGLRLKDQIFFVSIPSKWWAQPKVKLGLRVS